MKEPQPIWSPSPERMRRSNLAAYVGWLKGHRSREFADYAALYDWSIGAPAEFWSSVWEFFGMLSSRPFESVVDGTVIHEAVWFTGSRLNFAENLLRYRDDRPALVGISEHGRRVRLTFSELYAKVAACAAGFKRLGIREGDRVAAFIPNCPEAVIAMLAASSLGAVWSSCSPDFGYQGVLDRFRQITPKLLLTADGYFYGGKRFDCLATARSIAEAVPSMESTVVIDYTGNASAVEIPASRTWDEMLDLSAREVEFAQLPFDHPLYIMYSSGTTGAPKCIVHGAGGTLIQHLKELVLHTDLKRDDTIAYYTTTGWMMWNWLVSSLAVGATVVLYDGSPSQPNLNRLYDLIDDESITIFGTSPRFLASCEQIGLAPRSSHRLDSLRTVLSTGAPLSVDNFRYVHDHIKEDVQLASISGGTDIISCFFLGNPVLPVFAGELQCRGLGMPVETFDDDGRPVIDQIGELVCTGPFPSRPIYFWNDPGKKAYLAAYFEQFPGIWRHGDFVKINRHGGVVIYGRSDATLNPGGVRIGTAEIYSVVETFSEIVDSLVVEQKKDNDSRIVLFVVTASGATLTDELKQNIRSRLREQRTPRHVPRLLLSVPDIPRTLNGKKVELAVSRVIHGRPVTNRDALANPDALDYFIGIAELAW